MVVDKLLTGFDEPRNTVLYIDKPLREHTLLQAIARVNRLADDKDFGYIVDYRGVLGQLNEAMNLYDALADFDAEDVADTFHDIAEQILLLPQLHSDLWANFAAVANRNDREAMERFLEPEDRRIRFYEALTDYARALRVAMSSVQFFADVSEAQIDRYRGDLKYFHELRQAVKLRYAEAVDYREYEEKVRKLMDEHIRATGTTVITDLVNIFDVEKFDAEVERLGTPAAKADTILNRMKRTISALWTRTRPSIASSRSWWRKRSTPIARGASTNWNICARHRATWSRCAWAVTAACRGNCCATGTHRPTTACCATRWLTYGIDDERIADVAIRQEAVIEEHKITDWETNLDVQNEMRRGLDDIFYAVEESAGVLIEAEQLRLMIEQVIEVAKARSYGPIDE